MKPVYATFALVGILSQAGLTCLGQDSAPIPLVQAHSHNDYEHTRPLLDALDQGFCSIEADIYLVNGALLVAHERSQVRPERTLQALYLDPLRERVRRNQGRLFMGGPPAILLIDVKTEAEPTYRVLSQVLRSYSEMLTRFTREGVQTNAITAIISGNRAHDLMASEAERFAALDGRPEDLVGTAPKELIPLVSEDWKKLFAWRGTGEFPAAERQRLRELVNKAHAQGRKIRFWGTADSPKIWEVQFACGVDMLNADDLPGLAAFLRPRLRP